MALSDQDWHIRLAVYRSFVEQGCAPAYTEIAQELHVPPEDVRQSYQRLHQHHALFLANGTDAIRMAHPLSAVPTPFRVYSRAQWLWANCAWDALGIPAMLHADARIEATLASSGETVRYEVVGGALKGERGIVHFSLPFQHWYDDLVHT